MRKIMKNEEFRKKNLRGAKVEDLYIFVEMLKKASPSKEDLEEVQSFIEQEFGYEKKTV